MKKQEQKYHQKNEREGHVSDAPNDDSSELENGNNARHPPESCSGGCAIPSERIIANNRPVPTEKIPTEFQPKKNERGLNPAVAAAPKK